MASRIAAAIGGLALAVSCAPAATAATRDPLRGRTLHFGPVAVKGYAMLGDVVLDRDTRRRVVRFTFTRRSAGTTEEHEFTFPVDVTGKRPERAVLAGRWPGHGGLRLRLRPGPRRRATCPSGARTGTGVTLVTSGRSRVVFDHTFFGAVQLTRLPARLRTNLQPVCRAARTAAQAGSPYLAAERSYPASAGPRPGGIDALTAQTLAVGPAGAVVTVTAGRGSVHVEHRLMTDAVQFSSRMETATDANGSSYAERVADVSGTGDALSGQQSARALGGQDGCYPADAADGRLDAAFDSIGRVALTGLPGADVSVCVAPQG
jgi:hypothetical protein